MPHNVLRPETRQLLIDRINKLQPDSKGKWGKMNAHEMIVHSADGIRMARGEKPVRFKGKLLGRTLVKWVILGRGKFPKMEIKAPRPIRREGDGTPLGEFEADRKLLIEMIEAYPDFKKLKPRSTHHIFGPMSRREWGRLGYIHMDHHLRQFGV